MQGAITFPARGLMGQIATHNLTVSSPSYLDKGQRIKLTRSAQSFGVTGPVKATIGTTSVPVILSGQEILIELPSAVDPGVELKISLETPNPTVGSLTPDQLLLSILTSDNRTTASVSPLRSRVTFVCEPTCASCIFLSTNCTSCVSGYFLETATCILNTALPAFPVWLYPIFLAGAILLILALSLFRNPFNMLHGAWSVLSLIQMIYTLVAWILLLRGVYSGTPKYSPAVGTLLGWGIFSTILAGVLATLKIKKLANWREKTSWVFGLAVTRLSVTSRRSKEAELGWRLDPSDPLAEFDHWRKVSDLIGLGTFLAVNVPYSLGGLILWVTVEPYPYAIEVAIFQPLLGLSLLGSWWELRKVAIKPEHNAVNNMSKITQGTKIHGFDDDSISSLNPLVKNIHLDVPDSLIESSKETNRHRVLDEEGPMSKTGSRKGQNPNNKDSFILIEDGQQVPSNQMRSFVFDPENPTANQPAKTRYREVNKIGDDTIDPEDPHNSQPMTNNKIQLLKDPHKSQDSEEAKDKVGPLPPQKDYKIPLSSRLDTGREESQPNTSRKDHFLMDHSPGSEINRRNLESELNGISTPSGQYSSLKPQSDRYPNSISQRANYSAGHEPGNSLSSQRMLRAIAAHLDSLPTSAERQERALPLAANPNNKFPSFPKLELDKVQQMKLADELPNKDHATKYMPLSGTDSSHLSQENREYLVRPGKVPVSGRKKVDPSLLPKNFKRTEVTVDPANQRRLLESPPLASVGSKLVKPLEELNVKLAEPSRFRQNRLRERLGPEHKRYLEIVYEQDEGEPDQILRENPIYDDPTLDKQIQQMERAKIGPPPDPTIVEMSRGRKSLSELMDQRPEYRLDLARIKAIDKGSITFDDKTGTAVLENSGERVDHEKVHKILGTDPRILVRPEDTPESVRTRQKLLNAGIRLEAINSIEPAELERVATRTISPKKSKMKSGTGSPKDGPGTNRSGNKGHAGQIASLKIDPLSARKGYFIDDPENNHGLQDVDGIDSEPEDLGPFGPAKPSEDLLRSSQELLRKDLAFQLKTGKASGKDIAEKAHEYGLGGKLAQMRVAINPEDIVETSERLELKAINGQPLEAFVRRDLNFKDPATLPLKDQQPELMARGIYMDNQGRMLPVGDQPMEDVSRGLFRDPKGVPRKIAALKAEDLAKGIWMDPDTQKATFVNGQPANTLGSLLLLDRNGQKTNLRKQNKSDIAKGVIIPEDGKKVDLGVPQSRLLLDKGEFKWKDGKIYRWIDQTPLELANGIVRGMGRADQPFGGYDITRPIEEVQSVWPALDPKNKTNQNSHTSMGSVSSGVGGLSTNEIRARKKEFYDNDPYESKKKPSEPLVFPEDTDSYLVPTSQPYSQSISPNRGITGRNPLHASKSTVYNSMQSSARGVNSNLPIVDTLLINLVADDNESFDLSVRIEETGDDAPEEVVGIELSKPNMSAAGAPPNGHFNSSTTTSRVDSKLNAQPGLGVKYGRLPDLDVQTKQKQISGFDSNSVGNLRPDKDQIEVGRASLGDLKSHKPENKPLKSNRGKLSPLIDIDTGSPSDVPNSLIGYGHPGKIKNHTGQGISMPGTSTAAKRNNLIPGAMQTIPFPANSAKQLNPIKKPAKGLQAPPLKNPYESSPKYTPPVPLQAPINNKLQTTGHSDFLKKNYVDKLEREVERIKNRGSSLHKYSVGKGSLDRLDRTNGGQSLTATQKGSRDA